MESREKIFQGNSGRIFEVVSEEFLNQFMEDFVKTKNKFVNKFLRKGHGLIPKRIFVGNLEGIPVGTIEPNLA